MKVYFSIYFEYVITFTYIIIIIIIIIVLLTTVLCRPSKMLQTLLLKLHFKLQFKLWKISQLYFYLNCAALQCHFNTCCLPMQTLATFKKSKLNFKSSKSATMWFKLWNHWNCHFSSLICMTLNTSQLFDALTVCSTLPSIPQSPELAAQLP